MFFWSSCKLTSSFGLNLTRFGAGVGETRFNTGAAIHTLALTLAAASSSSHACTHTSSSSRDAMLLAAKFKEKGVVLTKVGVASTWSLDG